MQGLNNLAYASGLDNPRRSSTRSQQPAASKYSTTPNPIVNRVQSPMKALPQSTYSSAQPATYGSQDNSSSSTASPQLFINAALALAGAVSRKYPQNGGQRTASASLATGSSSKPMQRSNSPYTSTTNHQSQGQGSSSQPQTRTSPNQSSRQAPSNSQKGNAHSRVNSQTKRSAASQSKSISNLVSTTSASDPQTSTVTAGEGMPTYIDPTQVFNPYHKEHERRRREAAEAEVQRQEREAAEEKAEAERKRKEAEAAKTATKEEVTKKKAKNSAVKAASSEDATMANEMKLMMEKMKEFRSKDPNLFEKLWDDMRKGGGAAQAPASSSTPAPVESPQVTQHDSVTHTTLSQATPQGQDPTPSTKTQILKSQRVPAAAAIYPGAAASGYKVVVEDNDEGLPDLGRFPAERRIRAQQYDKKPKHPPRPGASAGVFPTAGLDGFNAAGQPLPTASSSGGVEWPKEKRQALAEAAIETLKVDGRNQSVNISQSEIIGMLELNPSYIQLCGMLEKRGLSFHRGQFARQLLISVPNLTTSAVRKESSQLAAPSQQAPDATSTQVLPAYQPPHLAKPGFVLAPVGQFQSQGSPSYPPYGAPPPGVKPERPTPPTNAQKGSKAKKTTATKPEPPPGSKEAMARKRDFSELVDLTQLSDNDDYVLSSKHPRLDSPSPEPDPFAEYVLQQNLAPNTVASSSLQMGLPNGTPLKFDPAQVHRPPQPTPPPQRPRTILARPLNKNEALRKSYYDPKSVARDILIATGRHPGERPLNAHLAGLLGVHVDMESDLSTFDWDAIDPGGPPAPKVDYVDIPAGPPRFKLGEYARPRRPPPGESRLPEREKREILEQPPHQSPTSDPFNKTRSEPRPSRLRESHPVDDQSPARSVATSQKRKDSLGVSPESSSRPVMEVDSSRQGHFLPSGKRRGRPPGAKNKNPSVTAMKKSAAVRPPQPVIEIPAPAPAPANRKSFKCKWRACETEPLHNLETLHRHIFIKHHPTAEDIRKHDYICWWKDCEFLKRQGETVIVLDKFLSSEEWGKHIEDDHLRKLALKFGDGPSSAQIGKHKHGPP